MLHNRGNFFAALEQKMQWREKKILAVNFMKYEHFMKSKTIELAGEYQIIHNPP